MKELAAAVKFLLAHLASTHSDPSVAKQAQAHHEAVNAMSAPAEAIAEAIPHGTGSVHTVGNVSKD